LTSIDELEDGTNYNEGSLLKLILLLNLLCISLVWGESPKTWMREQLVIEMSQLVEAEYLIRMAQIELENDQESSMEKLVKKAKGVLKHKTRSRSFDVVFWAKETKGKRKGSAINYFLGVDNSSSDFFSYRKYDVMINETCYEGDIKEARDLLKLAVARDLLNYDEEWFENPEILGGKLRITYVDGPGETRRYRNIKACDQ
jgi:hypothetical protein